MQDKNVNNKTNNDVKDVKEKDIKNNASDIISEPYAKGKRGIVYKEKLGDKYVCRKEKNPRAKINTLAKEAEYLNLLNKHGIGPKLIKYDNSSLYTEFIEGDKLSDFIEQENNKEIILSVIKQVLEQCRELDKLGINKKELTNPYKDIIVTPEKKVVMIDFERCAKTNKPKNVTQFLQYINRNKAILEKKGIVIEKEEMIRIGKEYKEKTSDKSFNKIIKMLK